MFWALLIPAALLLVWGIAEARFVLRISRHRLGNRGLRVVFISDVHCGFWMPPGRLKRVIDRISNLSPDMVLLGGDYIERGTRYVLPCLKALSALQPAAAVLGNHDIKPSGGIIPRDAVLDAMEAFGIPVLCNSSMTIRSGNLTIQIAGAADAGRDIAYLGHISRDEHADLMILLSHNPDFIPTGSGHLDFDIAVCGHTHGGQITLFGRPVTTHSIYRRELGRGLCRWRGKPVVVSNGIGTTILPMRFFAVPSIEVIEL